jgi:hypothetical protein
LRSSFIFVLTILVLTCVLGTFETAGAQDRRDWQSVAQLHAGDRIRLTLKTGSMDGLFQTWTPEQVMLGTVTARREDVLRIERFRNGGGMGRGGHAIVGALIGFGGGFTIGAAAGGCRKDQFGPCISRPAAGAVVGGAGAVVGAAIGALLPHHSRDVIYSIK